MTEQTYQMVVTDKANPGAQRVIKTGLSQYNREMAGHADAGSLSIFVSDTNANRVVGGLLGRTSLGLFFIDLFFLPKALRGNGIGTQVIEYAEAEARKRGCSTAVLYTITFQARVSMNGKAIGCLVGSNASRPTILASAWSKHCSLAGTPNEQLRNRIGRGAGTPELPDDDFCDQSRLLPSYNWTALSSTLRFRRSASRWRALSIPCNGRWTHISSRLPSCFHPPVH
jgi:GNAT superfamily N-acetyltransferase